MPAAPDAHASSFIDFIEESPTSYHAVASMVARLEAGGFTSVDETVAWHGIPGSGFVRRHSARRRISGGIRLCYQQPFCIPARDGERGVGDIHRRGIAESAEFVSPSTSTASGRSFCITS